MFPEPSCKAKASKWSEVQHDFHRINTKQMEWSNCHLCKYSTLLSYCVPGINRHCNVCGSENKMLHNGPQLLSSAWLLVFSSCAVLGLKLYPVRPKVSDTTVCYYLTWTLMVRSHNKYNAAWTLQLGERCRTKAWLFFLIHKSISWLVKENTALNFRSDLKECSASYRLSRGNSRGVNIISVGHKAGLNQY